MSRILYRGGQVYSAYSPGATAMLVEDDRIAWLGSEATASGLAEPDATVELDGAWLAPAFVDAHVHVVAAGLAMTVLDLSGTRSPDEVLDRVCSAARSAAADTLVWGTGWDDSAWQYAEAGRGPQLTAQELDLAGGGRPVYLARADVHSAVASSRLLADAGLSEADQPITGEAHHALRQAARRLLTSRRREEAAAAFFAAAARLGIGMVHECAGPEIGDPADLDMVRRQAGIGGIDLVAYWGEAGPAGIARSAALGAHPGGDLFVDGSLGSRTAALREPYCDAPPAGDAAPCGTLLMQPAEIAAHLVAATRSGEQAGFHVIGDAALEAVIQGLERASKEVGIGPLTGAHHRLEHLEMCGRREVATLARFGVIASVQPAFDARWGGAAGMYADRVGAQRSSAMNDLAGYAAAGIPLAFGSDAPVTPLDPWGALRAATSTTNPDHGLSVRAAFAAHTRGGHRAAGRDGGVLRPGSDATFAIWSGVRALTLGSPDERVAAWSTDPRAGAPGIPELDGPSPLCVATVVRGRIAFAEGPLTGLEVHTQPRHEVED